MQKVLITGAGGQVGLALLGCAPAGWTVIPCGPDQLDVTQPDQVRTVLSRERPTVVIHTAAWTAVDAAEAAPERAEAVNVRGTVHVSESVRDIGARLVHLSTDFVFDGARGHPYASEDPPCPLGVYGRTKLLAEREAARILGARAIIVRTAWVYSRHRQNFVRTMLRLFRERDEVGVVSDQVGTPTWAQGLAEALWMAAGTPAWSGVLHWTDAGVASWYDFAIAIQEEALTLGLLKRAVPVRPLRTQDYPTAARRPPYSVLDKSATWALLGRAAPHWRENLRRMLRELPQSE